MERPDESECYGPEQELRRLREEVERLRPIAALNLSERVVLDAILIGLADQQGSRKVELTFLAGIDERGRIDRLEDVRLSAIPIGDPALDWLALDDDREELVEQRDRARRAADLMAAMRKGGASERTFERGGVLLWHSPASGHSWISSKFFEWVSSCEGETAYRLTFESEGTTFDGVRHLHVQSDEGGYVFYPWDGDFIAALDYLRTEINPKPRT